MDKMLPSMSSTEQEKTIKESVADVASFMLQQQEVMLTRMEDRLLRVIESSKTEIMERMIQLENKVQQTHGACSVTSSRVDKTAEEQHFLSNHMIQELKDIKNNMSMTSQSLDFIIRAFVPKISSLKTSATSLSNKFDNRDSVVQNTIVGKKPDSETSSSEIASLEDKFDKTNLLIAALDHSIRNGSNAIHTLTQLFPRSGSMIYNRDVSHETMDQDNVRDTLVYKELQSMKTRIEETNTLVKLITENVTNDMTLKSNGAVVLQELRVLKDQLGKVENDIGIYNKKVVNNISDLWKVIYDFTNATNMTAQSMNATALAIDRDLKFISSSLSEDMPSTFSDDFRSLETKFKEMSSTLIQTVDIILFNQNSFSQSCQRIQVEEGQVYDEFDYRLESINETLSEINRGLFGDIRTSVQSNHERLKQLETLIEKLISFLKKQPHVVASESKEANDGAIEGDPSPTLNAEHFDSLAKSRDFINVKTSQNSLDNP